MCVQSQTSNEIDGLDRLPWGEKRSIHLDGFDKIDTCSLAYNTLFMHTLNLVFSYCLFIFS